MQKYFKVENAIYKKIWDIYLRNIMFIYCLEEHSY